MAVPVQRWVLAALALLGAIFICPVRAATPVPLVVPDEINIPSGPEGAAIEFGKKLVTDTRKLLPNNVGNGLNCTNCHLGSGTVAFAGPFVGLWGMFPEYRNRGGNIDSLTERINDCFERSMNGKALAYNSTEMNAMLMYINWLSTGVPVRTPVVGRGMGKVNTDLKPNPARGKQIYAEKCAVCHGATGEGTKNPAGGYMFPPVWGNSSFNIGAGMARTYTAAAFIRHNMPLGQGNTLSEQDAVDVAEFMTHQTRPAFAAAKDDYAKGNKPKDARNGGTNATGAGVAAVPAAIAVAAPESAPAVAPAAAPGPAASISGDAARGSQKVQMCQGCHGIQGWRTAFPETYRVPRIAGQHPAYLAAALKAYRGGERSHPSMQAIAASLNDQDIADVAAYYAQAGLSSVVK
jgi:thiosulfate dehydrogenase